MRKQKWSSESSYYHIGAPFGIKVGRPLNVEIQEVKARSMVLIDGGN